jgi:hypothetical protein
MAQLNEEFSVDTLPASSSGDFSPIPAGNYNVRVVKADLTDTKDGTGQYIKLRLDVVGPSHQGRVLWANLNIRNKSAKAEEIGRSQMGDLMRACGLAKVSDTDQFIGNEVSVKVEVKNDDTYGPGNEVKAFRSVEGAAPMAPAAAPTKHPAAAAADKKTPPWMKK